MMRLSAFLPACNRKATPTIPAGISEGFNRIYMRFNIVCRMYVHDRPCIVDGTPAILSTFDLRCYIRAYKGQQQACAARRQCCRVAVFIFDDIDFLHAGLVLHQTCKR